MSAVNYAAIKTAVVQWITDVAGSYLGTDANGDPFIFWHEDAHANMGEPHAALKLTDGGRQGMDAVDWVEDAPNRVLAPRVRGNRQVIVGITIRARADADIPRNAVEDLRTSLEHPLHMARLESAGGMAFVDIEGMVTGIGIMHDNRREALATLDVRFHVAAELFDATDTVERIEDAGITDAFTDAAGDPVDPGAAEELVGENNPL